ncbi:polysaccharide biosynthesis protein [Blautia sp. MSJ-19]|uniref:polysaccharide biosynthesis protein n=1 Tax=Blautia sp. MSJ-19 TaxID=2841517 RepID=UPI001C0E916B|nr:polysaccharide biosynthesis protein [Blautia sp. MSJ-19]MBU5480830.1 polysaccharide biosynthesis protein [Blautia sp. MSJ-19]
MSRNRFFKGTFLLTSAGLLSRIMGFFYRIFLSNIIGAEGIGLYQLVMPLQHLVLAMTASGIQTALSRMVAAHSALGEKKEARSCFCLGTLLSLSLSLSAAAIFFLFSDFFAVQILKEPAASSLIRFLSFSFPFAAIHACVNSYYIGLKKMVFPAGIQILEQTVRIFSSWLIYMICLSRNQAVTASIAVAGSFLSEFAAALFSLLTLSFCSPGHVFSFFPISDIRKIFSDISQIALPLTLNRLLLSVLASIEVVLIPQQLRKYGLSSSQALSLYGVFTGMALPCILFPSTITSSASVLLMPSVAEMQALGYRKRIRYVTRCTCSASLLLGSICTGLFYFGGLPAGTLLFHNPDAGLYIRILSFICPFLYMNIALNSILNGLGKTRQTLVHSIFGVLFRISFVVFAIPSIGIRGYLYGLLFSEISLSALHIYALYHMES